MYISKSNTCCSVCTRSPFKNPGLSLHTFPVQRDLKKRWMEACGFKDLNMCASRIVCSLHFEPKCITTLGKRKRLFYGSVPTIFSEGDIHKNIEAYENLGLLGEHLRKLFIQQIKKEPKTENYMEKRILRSSVSRSSHIDVKREKSLEKQKLKSSKSRSSHSLLPSAHSTIKVTQEKSLEKQILESFLPGPYKNPTTNKESDQVPTGSITFCPETMTVFENCVTHPHIWLCRMCHKFIFNRQAVDQHLNDCKAPKNVHDETLNS